MMVGYFKQDPKKGIISWRKELKITLPGGLAIPKVEMDTQIQDSINTCEAATYIDVSHDTCLRSMIYVE